MFSMSDKPKVRRRKPRLRNRVACLVLGHRWQPTSVAGYASRCRRCRLLWGAAVPVGLPQNDFSD
jgi:hypothetical protein